jgi:4-hydroxy-2-oxoheptanedioate aldolase
VLGAGKAAGCLSGDNETARDYLAQGATFVAVGVDTSLLVKAASQLAAAFKGGPAAASAAPDTAY